MDKLSLNKPKRLLTDKELDYYNSLQTEQSKKKYLDNIKDQLWETVEKK